MRRLIIIVVFLWPLLLAAQVPEKFEKGQRLHRVKRLKPVALPPGGLVPFQSDLAWGLSDTLGNLNIEAVFDQEVLFTEGSFALTKLYRIDDQNYGPIKRRWAKRNEDAEIWLNAHGQYLVVPADYAAYRQADGSLVAKRLRRHLAEPLYRYELDLNGQPDTPARRWEWWNKQHGWVRYLGNDLLAVRGPSERRYFRKRNRINHQHPVQHPPPAIGPPQAVFTTAGRRLTPYRYERIYRIQEGRIRYLLANSPGNEGYLNRQGKSVLGGFTEAEPFLHNRAVVLSGNASSRNRYLYSLIDTTGACIIPPQAARLQGPDSAGFVRRAIVRPDGRELWEYLQADGQPAFPGQFFGSGGEFRGATAEVTDTTGRKGLLHLDGSWSPRTVVVERTQHLANPPEPEQIVAIDSSHFQLRTTTGALLTNQTCSWAQGLAGGWFAARYTANGAIHLISPDGKAVPLPAGYTPDLHHHGPKELQEPPFQNGLVKLNWNEPWKNGVLRREAYMTRSGRILVKDTE